MTDEARVIVDAEADPELSAPETTAGDTPSPAVVHDPKLARGDTPEFKWYVAQALTGQENKVVKTLRERILNHGLADYFSRILVPEESVVSMVSGQKRTMKKKYFPGYVMIKMVMSEQTWHLVKNTDKVSGFLGGTRDKPSPIGEEEAAYMIGQVSEGFKKPRSSFSFSEGDSVRVMEGPFTSFVGTVEAVSDKGKLRVSVSIFGRPTPLELDFSQVKKTG